MTIKELKLFIFENKKIEYILSKLNCHNIRYNNKRNYYSAAQPDGDNPAGVNISNNEYLNYWSYTRGVSHEDYKDLISLVEYIKKCSFIDAVKYLHKILGLNYEPYHKQKEDKPKFDPLAVFKKAKCCRSKINVDDIQELREELLDEYVPILHINWFKEGIMPWTAKKFGLAYSYKRKRIITPIRHWLTGKLLGVNARTTIENYDELGIKKYYLTPSYQKSLNLFGLYENYNAIKEAGYVVVYEAEKSTLKRDSLNDATGVSLSGHTMSQEQANILIGLDVEIIIALDKDIPIEEIWCMCENFFRIRKVSYIYDKWDLLDDKQSPADVKNKIFKFLLKYRNQYDNEEHNRYLKSLKK